MAETVVAAAAIAATGHVLRRRRIPENAVEVKRTPQRINWKNVYTDPSDDIGNPRFNDRGRHLEYGATSTGYYGVPRIMMRNPVGLGFSTRIYAWPNIKSTYTAYQ